MRLSIFTLRTMNQLGLLSASELKYAEERKAAGRSFWAYDNGRGGRTIYVGNSAGVAMTPVDG